MAKRNLTVNLSVADLNKLVTELDTYANVILPKKLLQFVDRLSDIGIKVAQSQLNDVDELGNISPIVEIKKELDPKIYSCNALILMSDLATITREWLKNGGIKSVEVSPSLMAEFGSGKYAVDGYRGTFPDQTHAFEEQWYWVTPDGVKHKSSGLKPTQPLFNAMEEMYQSVRTIAEEVFST